jgi:short-subunit dehydrogenase
MTLPSSSSSSTCLVTGASSGIGADIARQLAQRGRGVTLVARREDRLEALADELSTKHRVRAEVVAADLADPASRGAMVDTLAERGLVVDVLVNNAGLSTSGKVHETDPAAGLNMIRINVEALTDLCHVYVPGMVERGAGAVLNIASTAAFQPIPGQAAYAATKAFVLRLTEGMYEELRGTGVTATALCPGPVRTEFMDVMTGGRGESIKSPDFVWMSSEDTAKAGVEGMLKGRRVVVPGVLNNVGALAGAHTPRSLLLPLVRRFYPLSH